ncbi:DMT family transporter [uncultured Psychrosphaera sp.]|uniref:DMT family transporter n=1 Tax=uncultured Psychrosphaera sp. TaxID=1403522 RepID=UPI0030F8EE6A
MKPSQFLELVILAAIWGASFMFMRVAAPEFGATALASYRMVFAALTLFPILLYYIIKNNWHTLNLTLEPNAKTSQQVIGHIFVLGITNSAIPMFLFAYAATNLDAGFSSIMNATTPLWGAVIGALLFNSKLSRLAVFGLLLGFIGVFVLSIDKLSWQFTGQVKGILAVICATSLYGLSANYSKRNLTGVKPLFIASGSLFGSALLMLPILIYTTPALSTISSLAWLMLISLSVVSTGIAYILYYRIIEHSGPTNAMTVTFLIPIFGVFFGYVFLNEQLNSNILWGVLLVLTGVLLTTGLLKKRNTSV